MREDSAQLPVDFLVGFTIFILCLIAVANFVPSLLVGLQRTSGIDYDAVAYRTGVVLTEDPGWPAGNIEPGEVGPGDYQPWEQGANTSISRLGLSLYPDTPNVLSLPKVYRFFCSTDMDYRTMLLFSPYQYGYNITLRSFTPLTPDEPLLNMSIGDPHPATYGYIRRYVFLKQNTNATIDMDAHLTDFNAQTADQVRPDQNPFNPNADKEIFKVRFQGKIIYNKSIPTPYTMDLLREPLTIRVQNLRSVLNNSVLNPTSPNLANGSFTSANLTGIGFYDCKVSPSEWMGDFSWVQGMDLTVDDNLIGDSNQHQIVPGGGTINSVRVEDNITLRVDTLWPPSQGFGTNWTIRFKGSGPTDPSCMELAFMFQNINQTSGAVEPHTLVTGTFLYDYFNVTRPDLVPGMLEVSIW